MGSNERSLLSDPIKQGLGVVLTLCFFLLYHNNNKCTLEGQGNERGSIEEGAGSALLAMQQHSTDSNNEKNAASSKQKISDCTTTLLISMEFCSHHPNANRKLHCKTPSPRPPTVFSTFPLLFRTAEHPQTLVEHF